LQLLLLLLFVLLFVIPAGDLRLPLPLLAPLFVIPQGSAFVFAFAVAVATFQSRSDQLLPHSINS
jgi:hypothetical protein